MNIHPTAQISAEANIAPEVIIGPNVVIEGPVRIDAHCVIKANSILTGWVEIAANNQIGYGSIIGAEPQSHDFSPTTHSGVKIGPSNIIREYVTIHRSLYPEQCTVLGEHNFLMTGAHLGHDCLIGDHNTLANNVLLGGHVEILNNTFLGGGAGFHQFVRIGSLAMIQGNASISKSIPPFTIASKLNEIVGLNIIGLKRAGFSSDTRLEIQKAYRLMYHSGLNFSQALAKAAEDTWSSETTPFFEFFRTPGKKGICGAPRASSKRN